MTCPRCSTQAPDDSAFCHRCGTRLDGHSDPARMSPVPVLGAGETRAPGVPYFSPRRRPETAASAGGASAGCMVIGALLLALAMAVAANAIAAWVRFASRP